MRPATAVGQTAVPFEVQVTTGVPVDRRVDAREELRQVGEVHPGGGEPAPRGAEERIAGDDARCIRRGRIDRDHPLLGSQGLRALHVLIRLQKVEVLDAVRPAQVGELQRGLLPDGGQRREHRGVVVGLDAWSERREAEALALGEGAKGRLRRLDVADQPAVADLPGQCRETRTIENRSREERCPARPPLGPEGLGAEGAEAVGRGGRLDEPRPGARIGGVGADRPSFDRVECDLVEAVEVDQVVELSPEGEEVAEGRELLGLLEAAERQAHEDDLAAGEGGEGGQALAQVLRPLRSEEEGDRAAGDGDDAALR